MRVGLFDWAVDRLDQVAEAGTLGGGILSYLVGSALVSAGFWGFESLRFLLKLNFLLNDDAEVLAFSGSEGVEIWLIRSPAPENAEDWVWGRGPLSL